MTPVTSEPMWEYELTCASCGYSCRYVQLRETDYRARCLSLPEIEARVAQVQYDGDLRPHKIQCIDHLKVLLERLPP